MNLRIPEKLLLKIKSLSLDNTNSKDIPIITIFIGRSACWYIDSSNPSKMECLKTKSIQTGKILNELFPTKSHIRLRLIYHSNNVLHRTIRFSGKELGREVLSGYFSNLKGPLSILSQQIAGEDNYYLITAMDIVFLKQFIQDLSEKALYLESIVPLPMAALEAVKQGLIKPDTALIFPGNTCTSIVLSPSNGDCMIRTINYGWQKVVDGLIEAGVSETEAISNVLTRQELQRGTAYEGIVSPFCKDLKNAIDETLSYFTEQLCAPMPNKFLLCGLEIPPGLYEGEKTSFNPVQLISEIEEASLTNLLKGTNEVILKTGRISYTFVPEKRSFQKLDNKPKVQTSRQSKISRRTRIGISKSPKQETQSVWGQLIKRSNSIKDSFSVQNQDGDQKELKELFLTAITILIVFYLAWGQYSKKSREYNNYLNNYAYLQRQNAEYSIGLINEKDRNKKPLWTEKMLELSAELTPYLWLTNVYFTIVDDKHGNLSVKHRVLNIEGATHPSPIGHIAEISKYYDRLTQNKKFMEGFSDLKFRGLKIDETTNSIVRFTFSAIYEGEVLSEEPDKSINTSNPSLTDTIQNHNDQLNVVK